MRLPPEVLRWLKFRPRRAGKDAKRTFFFHIPKCAGTSIWASLYDIYGTRYVYLVNSERRREKLATMTPAARSFYSAIGGHAPLSLFRAHMGDPSDYHKIVTLRHPVDRAISQYNYIRSQPSHPRYEEVSALSLDEFAASRSLRPNRQVILLTGSSDDVQGAVDIVTGFFDDWAFSDHIEAIVRRLYEITGTPPRRVEHKNKNPWGPRRTDVTPSTLSLIAKRNRSDVALIEALRDLRRDEPDRNTTAGLNA